MNIIDCLKNELFVLRKFTSYNILDSTVFGLPMFYLTHKTQHDMTVMGDKCGKTLRPTPYKGIVKMLLCQTNI